MIKEERISINDKEDEIFNCLLYETKSGQKLSDLISVSYRKELLKEENNPLRELLLCAPKETREFLPFLCLLAKKLSPPGTKITVFHSNKRERSMVVDKKRKIVFDNFHYFLFPHVKDSAKLLKKLDKIHK